MALTRKMLKGMSLTEEQIDTIIEAHSDTVEALKDERDEYKRDAEKLTEVQKELDDLKSQQEEDNPFEQKYNDLLEEFNNYKEEQDQKELASNKEKAYRKLLLNAGISEKRIDAIMRVTDLGPIELEDDGTIKDSKKYSDSVKTEWADFIVKEEEKGASVDNPPDNDNNDNDFKNMSLSDKMKYANEHPNDENVKSWLK